MCIDRGVEQQNNDRYADAVVTEVDDSICWATVLPLFAENSAGQSRTLNVMVTIAISGAKSTSIVGALLAGTCWFVKKLHV